MNRKFSDIKYSRPDKICTGNIVLTRRGAVYDNFVFGYHNRDAVKKMALVSNDYSPVACLRSAFSYKATCSPSKLYIDKDCKLNRDLYRNSDFKIVRDIASAERFIIPDLPQSYLKMMGNFVLYNKSTNTLYITDLTLKHDILDVDNDVVIENIKSLFDENGDEMEVQFFDLNNKCFVEFIPKLDCYIDIIEGKYPNTDYAFESSVEFKNQIGIDCCTLDIWKNTACSLLLKIIPQSNWRDYPFTIFSFISNNHAGLFNNYDRQIKYIIDSIRGTSSSYNLYEVFKNKLITPKDWDMYQDYMMHECGVEGESGIITRSNAEFKINRGLNVRIYAKKIHIKEPMTLDNIYTLVN